MSLSYWDRTWLSSVECRDVSGCACSIDRHDLYLRQRDLNQHELTVVSIGFTFTENRAETARVTWAFVALWCHRWHFDLQYVLYHFIIYCNHFRIARRRTRIALSAAYLDSIFTEPHTTPRTAKPWSSKWWQSFSTFDGFASRFYAWQFQEFAKGQHCCDGI